MERRVMKMKRISAAVLFALIILLVISPVTSRAEDREGYWERIEVSHELKHFNEELVDKNYWSDSMSGSAGTGTFTSTYVGPTEKDDYAPRPKNGESAIVIGSFSTPPKYINGGETVKLELDLSISSTKQHYWDFRGEAGAHFDSADISIGGITGGAIAFTAKDPEGENLDLSAWLYAPTNWRAEEYGNNPEMNAEVSAEAPYGWEEGDKIALYTQIGMGNKVCRTKYVYAWHAEGKAPAEEKAPSESQKRSDEEKRILEAWKNNQKEEEKRALETRKNTQKETEEPAEQGYGDSGIRFSDLWGQVAIRRAGEFDDAWEYCYLDTVIHHGDEIWTEYDSGAVLSFTDMGTFVIKQNTKIAMPLPAQPMSSLKILTGNVWANMKKMWYGGEFNMELTQAVAGIKGTTFAVEQTDELSSFYLFTSSAEVTSKITGEKVTLKPGEYAEVADDGIIAVKTFDIPSKAKELSLSMEILKDDGYKAAGYINVTIILLVVGIVVVILLIVTVIIIKKKKTAQHLTEQNMTQGADVYREYEPESPMPSGKKYFCGNCGSELKQGAKFCMKCGKKL